MGKKRSVAILFGGRSAEHDVSIMSARNVIRAIDAARYEIVPIKVERDGRWLLQSTGADRQPNGDEPEAIEVALLPGDRGRLITAHPTDRGEPLPRIDVIFPVLHGPFGEDGTIQGLAETAGLPYVGCGVLSSALCMDKDLAKRLLVTAGVPVARSMTVIRGEKTTYEAAKHLLGTPVFVKPARQGSSFGVGKADGPAAFDAALDLAWQHDDKLLIEEFVAGREVECAVLERPDGSLTVSEPGEIIAAAAHPFYTYEAKYVDTGGTIINTPANLPAEVSAECRRMAEKAFRTLDCAGMARVDFFLRPDGSLLLNEVNTIPGFTNMSMYPRALAAAGVSYEQTVDILIETAMARQGRTPASSATA